MSAWGSPAHRQYRLNGISKEVSVVRDWGDEKQTAKQSDDEWAVRVARKPRDYGIIRTN